MSESTQTSPTTTDAPSADSCCNGHGKASGGGCCRERASLSPLSKDQIAALPTLQLIARYQRGIEWIDRRVFELSERQIDQAFLPDAGVGRWPVRVLIGHVCDADLAAVHRMRRAVAEDSPIFSEWDENAFVDANLYGNTHEGYADDPDTDHARVMNALGGFLATTHTLRQWTAQWLYSLSDAQMARAGMHPTRGQMSVRDILASYTWHLEHHCQFLTKKLDLMVGPMVEKHEHSGGCGCKH